MGWKASVITIKSPSVAKTEDMWLLEKLGISDYVFSGETSLEECIYPRDNSVSIGEFNDCIIICDDFRFTDVLWSEGMDNPVAYERALSEIFPDSEILSAACHSVTNFHLYSMTKSGKRLRFKTIDGDNPKREYGELLEEEKDIYSLGERGGDVTEDQLMEDFTFGVLERHLGFRIDEGDELYEVKLRKYMGAAPKKQVKSTVTVNEMLAGQVGDMETDEEGEALQPRRGSWLSRLFGRK